MATTPQPVETVRVRIVIDIQAEDTLETGLTVAQWNALDPAARRTIIRDHWDGMLGHDNGSVTILPPGATKS